MIVATLGLGALLAIRAQARAAALLGDQAEARYYALSAIDLGRLWIAQDPQWRTLRENGVWASNQPIGSGTFTLEVTDPVDANLANRPHDPVIMKATAVKGLARQVIQVTLTANPTPLPALACALHTGGQLHVNSGKQLSAGRARLSTNGSLRNDGTITGSVEAGSATAVGVINGTLTLGGPAKAFPDPSVINLYVNLGTEITVPATIDKQVLAPGYNSLGGPTNAEGVYVIRSTTSVTIKNTRVNGTLVILCPGKKVIVDNQVLLQPSRPDYPALIVQGDLALQYTTSATPLSEPSQGYNYNPPAAPYQGSGDSDKLDQYPSEIQGMVHVTGTLEVDKNALVRGSVICESTALADAVVCKDNNTIVYTPSLLTNPPQGYTTGVKMQPQSGTWKQLVD
jgi:hypothetical protein